MPSLTWEQAVQWLREQPDQEALVRACYYDDPLIEAAQRFADSEEWQAMQEWLPGTRGAALDLGAGRGISSYALARAGWQVTALEPDSSSLVGSEAIRALARQANLPIRVVEDYAENMPFEANSFDLVLGRQVLHHAHDLIRLCAEAARVLKPGGRFIATREHVISTREQLPAFLADHPLQRWYGGENAFLLEEYEAAIRSSGLSIRKVIGPLDSAINYAPRTREQVVEICRSGPSRRLGPSFAQVLTDQRHLLGRWLLSLLSHRLSRLDTTPGRLYSFVADKNSR